MFKHKIFVVKIGGEVVQSERILENIIKDIKELFDHGIKVLLVHGGGMQADDLAKQMGHIPTKVAGRRVTGAKDLEIVKMLYGGSLNLEILSIMRKMNFKGVRVSGLDGNFFSSKLRSKKKFDYGFVGDITSVDPHIVLNLLNNDYLPVISPIGVTDNGVIVNINADTIATKIATELNAEKLVFLTSSKGVYNGENLLHTLASSEAKDLIGRGIAKDGMIVKLQNCIEAVEGGVKRVHIIDGLSEHSLIAEVLTKDGVGTMITSDEEKTKYIQE